MMGQKEAPETVPALTQRKLESKMKGLSLLPTQVVGRMKADVLLIVVRSLP